MLTGKNILSIAFTNCLIEYGFYKNIEHVRKQWTQIFLNDFFQGILLRSSFFPFYTPAIRLWFSNFFGKQKQVIIDQSQSRIRKGWVTELQKKMEGRILKLVFSSNLNLICSRSRLSRIIHKVNSDLYLSYPNGDFEIEL